MEHGTRDDLLGRLAEEIVVQHAHALATGGHRRAACRREDHAGRSAAILAVRNRSGMLIGPIHFTIGLFPVMLR